MIKSKSEWNEEVAENYVRREYTRCPICGGGDINGDQARDALRGQRAQRHHRFTAH